MMWTCPLILDTKNFGERHHSELVTMLCLLVVMDPTGTLLPVPGADVVPSVSFSNISTTTAARWTSPQSAKKHMAVTAASVQPTKYSFSAKQHRWTVPPWNLYQGYMMPHTGEYMRYIASTVKHRHSSKDPTPPGPTTLTTIIHVTQTRVHNKSKTFWFRNWKTYPVIALHVLVKFNRSNQGYKIRLTVKEPVTNKLKYTC
jgi:hypothetical protein